MTISLTINNQPLDINCAPTHTLLQALRLAGYFSVRFGSDDGQTGAAAILLDGQLVNSDTLLAGQAEGHRHRNRRRADPSASANCIPSKKRSSKRAPFSPATRHLP